jgi:hypothetical protein
MATPPVRKAPARARKTTPKPVVKTMPEVVAEGDRRAALVALRDHLAQRLLVAEKDAAPLARQLADVLRQIDEIPAPEMESTLDDLAGRRAARRSAATG